MAGGRHREDPVPRSLRLLVPGSVRLPVVAAGLGVALVSGTLVVTLRPDPGDEPTASDVAAAQDLRSEAALRSAQRAGRDRALPPAPAAGTSTPTPSASAPAATPSAPSVVRKLWAAAAVNVRFGPSADADRIGSLAALSRVGSTGRSRDGWIEVVVDRRAGWVRSTYLARARPRPQAAATAAALSGAACSISPTIEQHLTANASEVYRAVCAEFGDTVSSFGGYRAGDDGDHGSGRALDIMVSGDPGSRIARYVQAHAADLHVTYVIYQQRIWMAGDPVGRWKLMEDRHGTTANHFDHVHVSVS